MKILLVHPGAAISVHDVHDGLRYGLRAHGVEVIDYGLYGRIKSAKNYMHWLWRKAEGKLQKPTWGDVLYHAGSGLLERAVRHEVDLVLAVSGMFVHPDALVLLRRAGVKTGILFTESPYAVEEEMRLAQFVDVAWTMERTSVGAFKSVCPNAFYLAHAWHPLKHVPDLPLEADIPKHDVVFVGTGWPERVELFEGIDWSGIDFGLYGPDWKLSRRSPLRAHLRRQGVPNERTAQLYRAARIGLNLHRSLKGFDKTGPQLAQAAQSMNPRALELAACGVFSLSDTRAEVVETFDDAVPTFETAAQAETLIRHYLAHEDERLARARRLPAMVAEDSWLFRAAEVIGHISTSLAGRRAAA